MNLRSAKSNAKCILSGEHTLLRGGEALVLPLKSFSLEVEKIADEEGIWIADKTSENLIPFEEQDLLQVFLEDLFKEPLPGLRIRLNMPLGCGLGGSAALAVCLVRLFRPDFSQEALFEAALQIEHFFHGESSGVDIVGVLAEGPQLYKIDSRKRIATPISFSGPSPFFLSFCGETGLTKAAIEKVSLLREKDPKFSQIIDTQMRQATQIMTQSMVDNPEDFKLLVEGMNLAKGCFEAWGLVTKAMHQEMQTLLKKGALAVKPTGSGLGGFILSIWDQPPLLPLIPVSFN